MLLDEVLRGVRRPELVQQVADEARRLRRTADQVRRVANTSHPPVGVEPEWWDEQARLVARTLDTAALALEQIAHLPVQVDPLPTESHPVPPHACGRTEA
jgi:hypothetical protein